MSSRHACRIVGRFYQARLQEQRSRVAEDIGRDENGGGRHVYHLYVIQHEQRDALLQHLKHEGIFCGIHYPIPLNQQQPYLDARTVPEGLPITTELSKKILSLPMFPELSEHQIHRVVEGIVSFCP